jgi:hypothetical protein
MVAAIDFDKVTNKPSNKLKNYRNKVLGVIIIN